MDTEETVIENTLRPEPPWVGIDLSAADLVTIGVTIFIAGLLVFFTLRIFSPYWARVLDWIDKLIPLDLSLSKKVLSQFVPLVGLGVIFFSAGIIIAGTLDFEISEVVRPLVSFAKDAGRTIVPKLLPILFIILLAWFAIRLTQVLVSPLISHMLSRRMNGRHYDTEDVKKRSETLSSIIKGTTGVFIVLISFLTILAELGISIGPLLAGIGVVGLAIGLGAQSVMKDIIGGLFIILEDQYRKGDVVRVSGVDGVVEEITLRNTVLRDIDGTEHHVPNGEITIASNLTKNWSRVHLKISVDYSTDIDRAMEVLNRIGKEMAEDEQWKDDFIMPVEAKGIDDFADSAIVIQIIGETNKPMRQWDIKRELRRRIKRAFDEEGIVIPLPHLTVNIPKNA